MLEVIYDPLGGNAFSDGDTWINGDLSPTIIEYINLSKSLPEGIDMRVSNYNVITALCVATKRGIVKPGEVMVTLKGDTVSIDKYGHLDVTTTEGMYLGVNEMLMELF